MTRTGVTLSFVVDGEVTPVQATQVVEQMLADFKAKEPEVDIEFVRTFDSKIPCHVTYMAAEATQMEVEEEEVPTT